MTCRVSNGMSQDPMNTQNFNRYGYVFNNPLKYTDPTGEFGWSDVFAVAEIVVGVVLSCTGFAAIGAPLIGAGVTHFAQTYAEYKQTGDWNAASANAGFTFGINIKTDFGYGSDKKDTANNNNPVENHGYVTSGQNDTGPGAMFNTEKDAAIDFGMNYNSYAILNKTEIITTIYDRNGRYSYVVPLVCGGFCDTSSINKSLSYVYKLKGSCVTASAHLHPGLGKLGKDLKLRSHENSLFSGDLSGNISGDISTYNSTSSPFNKRVNGYVGNPNGGMNFYDATQNYTPIRTNNGMENKYDIPFYKGLPSDPNVNQYRLNNINPFINPNFPIKLF